MQQLPNTGHKFQKGNTFGISGRPAAGLQSFKDRLAYWMDHKTIGEIKAIIDNPKKWNKLLSSDAMVARRIHEAASKNGNSDFIALLDRLLGKPAITAEVAVTHGLAERLDKAEALMLDAPVIDAKPIALTESLIVDPITCILEEDA